MMSVITNNGHQLFRQMHVVSFELANKSGDMSLPLIERFFAFGEEIVPLIDSRDSGDRSRLMVEDLVRDMGGIPIRTMPDTTVRLRSCRRQPLAPQSLSRTCFDWLYA